MLKRKHLPRTVGKNIPNDFGKPKTPTTTKVVRCAYIRRHPTKSVVARAMEQMATTSP